MLISVNGVFVSADAYNILISLRLKIWCNQDTQLFNLIEIIINRSVSSYSSLAYII